MHAATANGPPGGASQPARRPAAIVVAGWLAAAGCLGSLVMALAHLDAGVLSRLFGPGRLILPAAIGFSVGSVAFAAASFGLWSARRWGWFTAAVTNVVAAIVAAWPIRGWFSVVALAVAITAFTVLMAPSARSLSRRATDAMSR